MRKIKVLHAHTLSVVSGSGISTLLELKGLNKERFEIHFACAPGGPLIEQIEREGIKFQPVNNFVQRVSLYNDLKALWQLICLINREKYDIVHGHNSKAGFIVRIAAKITGVPIVVHTIHGFSFHKFEKPLRRALFILLERVAAKFSDKLIAISEPLRKWGVELGVGRLEQYVTIYRGIEVDKFNVSGNTIEEKKQEFGIKPSDLVVGAVAKLWEGKGHRCILQAAKIVAAQVPDVKFMFVGEGYLREELEVLAKNLGLNESVIFCGFRNDIPELTAVFDVALLVSLFEGLGRVLLEAMVLGKPVVATRVGGIVDVVDDGKTGILVEPGDAPALARAIINLLGDKDLRESMGRAGREKVDVRFDARTMVEKTERVYEELVSKKLKKVSLDKK